MVLSHRVSEDGGPARIDGATGRTSGRIGDFGRITLDLHRAVFRATWRPDN